MLKDSGNVDHSPLETDFEFTGEDDQVLSGAHPLPLNDGDSKALRWPLVSPYMPAPQRIHPYWQEPPAEWPHFGCSVPIVYSREILKSRIIVPVHNLEGEVTHTRELDPFLFGQWPQDKYLNEAINYWVVRCVDCSKQWDYAQMEIFRKSKKNWPNTGTGNGRVGDRKDQTHEWGARNKAMKPWEILMPTCDPTKWQYANRMMLTLKMLQGKLQVVERLTLPEPSVRAYTHLCHKMQWDVRHDGAGVLFMDGGSRIAPSMQFDNNFFYGSFHNGRNKVVRPSITAPIPYDDNRFGEDHAHRGPKGQKNPLPINRFNPFDAFEHHLLVVTEGALIQLEQEMEWFKLSKLPPHILNQLPDRGMLQHSLLGDQPQVQAIEREVADRTEEAEQEMYEPYYDNPYKPWADENEASYSVDAVDGKIRRHTPDRVGSWMRFE